MPNIDHPTVHDLEVLAEVSQILTLGEIDAALHRVISLVVHVVDAVRGAMYISNHDDDTPVWAHYSYPDTLSTQETQDMIAAIMQQGVAGWVFRTGEGVIISDTEHDERWYMFPGGEHNARAVLCLPLIAHDRMIGVMILVHNDPRHFTDYHYRLVSIIANQIAVAVTNARTMQRLQAQRRQFETILQAIPDTLLVLDQKGVVVLVTDAIITLLSGYRRQQIVGKTIDELAQLDSVFAPITRIIDGAPRSYETWSFESRSEERSRDFLVNVSTWDLGGEEYAGYVIVMNDITTLRNLGRFKDQMLRLISHDLRTPLVLITGYADLLSMDMGSDETLQGYVTGIYQATERMDNLLDNMLRVEKIRSTPLELHEAVDLKSIVVSILHTMRPLAAQNDLRLESQVQLDDAPSIFGDSVLLQQAMENYVTNAIKYTAAGGKISINAFLEHRRFNFLVLDTGIGIQPDELPYVFESFYRTNTAGKTASGMGLGLSLVRNVIEQHGGGVWVESEVGKGSCFGLWLPLVTTPPDLTPPP